MGFTRQEYWSGWQLVLQTILQLKKQNKDFLGGGVVVKNPPANAGNTGPAPGPRRSTGCRAAKTRTTITEAHAPWSPSSATREGATVRSPGLQLEKAHVQQRRPSAAKNK